MSKLFSFLTFLILLTKTYSDDLGHVYSVGRDGSSNVALWISSLDGSSSQEIVLPGGESDVENPVSGATGVALSNTHIYSVGRDSANNAALWISSLDGSASQEIILPGGESNGTNGGGASGVALSNTHIYSVGEDSAGNAALWISSLDGSTSQEIMLPGGEYNGTNGGEASGVALSNTHIYSVGRDSAGNAALWISSLDGSASQEIILPGGNGTNGGVASGVALSNTHIYSVGLDSAGNAALWISSLDGSASQEIVLQGGNGTNGSQAYDVALSNTHVYSVGNDSADNAALWISSLDGSDSQEIILPGGNGTNGSQANGVALSNTHIYSVGNDSADNAALWISSLDGSDSQEIILPGGGHGRGVAVFSEPAAKLLLENLNRYSPFVRLKR